MEVREIIGGLAAEVEVDLPAVRVVGDDPILPSVFRVGAAAAACVGAVTGAVATYWSHNPGTVAGAASGEVAVDVREAAVAFRDERYFRIDGMTPELWAPLSGDYRTADGGWVRLHCNFDHHRDAVLHALELPRGADRAAVVAACAGRAALDVEDVVTRAGGCAAAMRSRAQWRSHPQGRAVEGLPLIGLSPLDRSPVIGSVRGIESAITDVVRGGDGGISGLTQGGSAVIGRAGGAEAAAIGSVERGRRAATGSSGSGGSGVTGPALGDGRAVTGLIKGEGSAVAGAVRRPGARPLAGVRVLDLTRVIAGPVATRTLAAYGAEVLRVGAAHLPEVPGLVISTALGKRSCEIDLRTAEGTAAFKDLVMGADVVVQSYRPGALARLGFGPRELAAIRSAGAAGTPRRPGVVCVDISAYGSRGPWSRRRGFDSLVQMVCGIAHEQGQGARPVPLPAQVLDHATGWLAALGAIAGLLRRQREGGSWHVELSLARTALWLDRLGRVDGMAVGEPEVGDLLEEMDSSFGTLTYVRAPGAIGDVRPSWTTPPPRRGEHLPAWR
ncbi:CoA transferase [Sphaerisporangium rhizosphaerae]|uniref:CoA transferase n=1 Tax=Sphaerisporangium rhizosphaerae TaxID=2269375 RepID=A0ABW2P4C6_9ACTN